MGTAIVAVDDGGGVTLRSRHFDHCTGNTAGLNYVLTERSSLRKVRAAVVVATFIEWFDLSPYCLSAGSGVLDGPLSAGSEFRWRCDDVHPTQR